MPTTAHERDPARARAPSGARAARHPVEGRTGFDFAATLRDAYRIPFMCLSAFSDESTLARCSGWVRWRISSSRSDVGQIVPAVEAAFGASAMAPRRTPPRRRPTSDHPVRPPTRLPIRRRVLALATGVLMHATRSAARGPAAPAAHGPPSRA